MIPRQYFSSFKDCGGLPYLCEAIKDYTPLRLIMKDRADIDQRQNDELRPIFK